MSLSLQTSKELRKHGSRLGRAGLSQRINDLVLGFAKNHPNGHYREAIILAGRLHAIALAARADGYWGEKAFRGFNDETFDLAKFETRDEGQD
mgnify:CR=1 FL=1